MRLGIIGLGGIGGYFGTKLLLRYGQEHWIGFLQRGRHLQAIREEGLTYITLNHRYTVRPHLATDRASDLGQLDMAIIAVKSYDLEEALKSIECCLAPEGIVITTLNGVDIAARCRNVLPRAAILPGCIYLSAHTESPGVVRQVGGVGRFYFGPEDGSRERYAWIEKMLLGAGIKAVLEGDIKKRLWEKYLFVSALATATAAHGLSIGQVVQCKEEEVVCLMQEIISLARAEGILLEEGLVERNLELARSIPPETQTSMQLDLENNRRAELDIFTEYVIGRSQEKGLDCPCHLKLYEIIRQRSRRG